MNKLYVKGKKPKNSLVRAIVEQASEGATIRGLATEYGMAYSTIRGFLYEAQFDREAMFRADNKETLVEMEKLLNEGMTTYKIGQEMGLDYRRVRKFIGYLGSSQLQLFRNLDEK